MFQEFWSSLQPYLSGETREHRFGVVAVGVYVVLSVGSVIFGLSGDIGSGVANDLGAQIAWGNEVEGAERHTLMLTNQSGDDWTDVRLILDERYYHHEEDVPGGHSMAIRAQDFEDGYVLPRPSGLFAYEQLFGSEDSRLDSSVPASYEPVLIRLSTGQGDVIISEGVE